LLLKCLYGLKQVAKAIWRQPLCAAKAMGLTQSNADPCLYFKWVKGRIVMVMSWINDNAIIGQESDVLNQKNELKTLFECNDCEPMVENTWDARLRNASLEGSRFSRKCSCKATGMSLISKI
jgi:hypothetical protein